MEHETSLLVVHAALCYRLGLRTIDSIGRKKNVLRTAGGYYVTAAKKDYFQVLHIGWVTTEGEHHWYYRRGFLRLDGSFVMNI